MVTPVAAPFLSAAFSLRSRSSSAFRSSSDIVAPCQLSHWAEEFIGGLSRVQTVLENFFHASDSRCSESTGSSPPWPRFWWARPRGPTKHASRQEVISGQRNDRRAVNRAQVTVQDAGR